MTVINTISFIAQQLTSARSIERCAMPALLSDLSGYDGTRAGPAHFVRIALPDLSGLPALVYPFESMEAFHNATLKWLGSARRVGIKVDVLHRLLVSYTLPTQRNTSLRYAIDGNAIELQVVAPALVDVVKGKKQKAEPKKATATKAAPAPTAKPAESKKAEGKKKQKPPFQPVSQTPAPSNVEDLRLNSTNWSRIYKLFREGVINDVHLCLANSNGKAAVKSDVSKAVASVGRSVGRPNVREIRNLFDVLGRETSPVITVTVNRHSNKTDEFNVSVAISGIKGAKERKLITGRLNESGKLVRRVLEAIMKDCNMSMADVARAAVAFVAPAPVKKPAPKTESKAPVAGQPVKPEDKGPDRSIGVPAADLSKGVGPDLSGNNVVGLKPTSIAAQATKALEKGQAEGPKKHARTPAVQPVAKTDTSAK